MLQNERESAQYHNKLWNKCHKLFKVDVMSGIFEGSLPHDPLMPFKRSVENLEDLLQDDAVDANPNLTEEERDAV